MKLLFDQNISYWIVPKLSDCFPGCKQVRESPSFGGGGWEGASLVHSRFTTSAGFSTLDLYTCHPTQRTITNASTKVIDK